MARRAGWRLVAVDSETMQALADRHQGSETMNPDDPPMPGCSSSPATAATGWCVR